MFNELHEDKNINHYHFLLCPASSLFKEDRIREVESGLVKTKTRMTIITMIINAMTVTYDNATSFSLTMNGESSTYCFNL